MPTALDGRHRGLIEQLQSVSRRQFAELYMQQQVQAHEEAAAFFSSYASTGDRPALRRFAGTVLPIIRRHLDMARSLSFEVQHARR